MAQPPEPRRSQSSTSLYKMYHGPNGGMNGQQVGEEELQNPRLFFCNSFWGPGERGYDVIMARLRGAGRTVEELRAFWKERSAIEEDYAKRLNKLSRTSLGRDEVGDLADSLKHLLAETAQQASYHSSLGNEIKQTVEHPTSELSVRMNNLKKGLQAAIEKSYRSKGLQEGHVQKARERYEQDCLKINSYTAQSSLTQGKELDKLLYKLERVKGTIGANEHDFLQFVKVLEGTSSKWEQEWKNFCDHVQDIEEDRLSVSKDLMWVYANAVSQVCVEDDSSCERIREKLEQFEPANDIINFVKGWGTGDLIPDTPRFINYSAGESYPIQPAYHVANFMRISAKPPMTLTPGEEIQEPAAEPEPEPEAIPEPEAEPETAFNANGLSDGMKRTTLRDEPVKTPVAEPGKPATKPPFGGVALPGMSSATSPAQEKGPSYGSMPPPPVPSTLSMPEPRVPSRQSQGPPSPRRDINDEQDPMAKALAELRRDPPPPSSVRRAPSHKRADSVVSAAGSARGSAYGGGIKSPASPGPGRHSYHQGSVPAQSRSPPIDSSLSPPPGGHTAAALARSMDEFKHHSAQSNRNSVNYSNFADDIVGSHPTSRPTTPVMSPITGRGPSPAMMQAPKQPATHIADEVLSQYHQAFPGEREQSRSRAGSVMSNRSRSSFIEPPQQAPPSPSAQPRQGFVGIGAGGAARSPSPQPSSFRSPSPSPAISPGALGPQNLGISLNAKGGVAQDTMAEQYRRQYQQQQQQQNQPPPSAPGPQMGSYLGQGSSQYGASAGRGPSPAPSSQPGYGQRGSVYSAPKSPVAASPIVGPPAVSNRPISNYGQSQQQQYDQNAVPSPHSPYAPASQPAYGQYASSTQAPYTQQAPAPEPNYSQRPNSGYNQGAAYGRGPSPQPQQQPMYAQNQGYQGQQYARGVSPAPGAQSQQYQRGVSPAPGAQAQQYQRGVSPAPAQAQQYARGVSPAPGAQQYGRGVSPVPGVQSYGYDQHQQGYGQPRRSPSPVPNQPPANATPTGQWSTTGLPVLFYVKALYTYEAKSSAEFDFQEGDIIAVTSTPEDGWWSGELLDEARRIAGRTDFPSNLYVFFNPFCTDY
ncbi:septation protein imp2 [Cryptococcus wingfieldii CBS 7118]|uniref:Septation protein imp2 n=1 Tax=Cryptococcus wingfieldii CBS 7118 TaxID=1295528 RepID=A0A1E3JRJ1_9TREE|nr:septation protein imp2 [Cryptococcus wingfieldii CBS 7118]ODO03499.1 septation protein imp2 [Cryptococcus wingfieldii CBS 7118]